MVASLTEAQVIAKSKAIHGDKYDYSQVNYINNNTKITIICKKHGPFEQTPGNHTNKTRPRGCPNCKNKTTDSELLNRLNPYANLFDFDISKYKKQKLPIPFYCKTHNKHFEQCVNTFLKGKFGCKDCTHEKQVFPLDDFIKQCNIVHNFKYTYDNINYAGVKYNIVITCPIHGDFITTGNKHLNVKIGCATCYKERVASKKCLIDNCDNKAEYNIIGTTDPLYCKEHKTDAMKYVKNGLCKFEGCGISGSYKIEGIKGRWCITHLNGRNGTHSNICNYEDKEFKCTTRASFGIPETNTPIYCKAHKYTDSNKKLIDVTHKDVCIACNKRACFNYLNEPKAIYCDKHKLINMKNIVDKRCIINDCQKIPIYNFDGHKERLYCNKHKENGMINVQNKKCIFNNCKTRASYNFDNLSAIYCYNHKQTNMRIVRGLLYCKLCNLVTATKKYDYYCFNCYCDTFPEKEIVRNYKIKENTIVNSIKIYLENFSNIEIYYDQIIQGGTSKKRPNILIKLVDYNIIIEIDEHQHIQYDDISEHERINLIYNDLNKLPLIVIRFNPDNYDDWQGLFCLDNNYKLVIRNVDEYNNRVERLFGEISNALEYGPAFADIDIVKLFYNSE